MLKFSKELYACGCSYTSKNWIVSDANKIEGYETGPHPMWPEILAKKLNLKEVNHGLEGHGNDYIMQNSVKYILDNHKKIDVVCIQWSELTRMWVYDMNYFNPSVWLDEDLRKFDRWGDDFVGFPNIFGDRFTASIALMKYVARDPYTVVDLFKKYLREIYTLQKLCEELKIKYIFGQGFPAHQLDQWRLINPDLDWKETLNCLIGQPEFHLINKKKFMGWPCLPELGGMTMTTGHPDFEPRTNRLNPMDDHPSAKGQELIAKQFHNKYVELYG